MILFLFLFNFFNHNRNTVEELVPTDVFYGRWTDHSAKWPFVSRVRALTFLSLIRPIFVYTTSFYGSVNRINYFEFLFKSSNLHYGSMNSNIQ